MRSEGGQRGNGTKVVTSESHFENSSPTLVRTVLNTSTSAAGGGGGGGRREGGREGGNVLWSFSTGNAPLHTQWEICKARQCTSANLLFLQLH